MFNNEIMGKFHLIKDIYDAIYAKDETGFVDVSSNGIQLSLRSFMEHFPHYDSELFGDKYPGYYAVSTTFDGIYFHAVADAEDSIKYGLAERMAV